MSAGGRPLSAAPGGGGGERARSGPAAEGGGAPEGGRAAAGGGAGQGEAGEAGEERRDDGRGGLRAALSGLTTRGRSFLAAGVAAAVCAYLLGQSDLLRVGMLLAALPLVCVLVLHRTRYRVSGSRRLSPARVAARAEARVHLRIDNVSRLPTGLLMLQDLVPYVLGPRPRFVLDRVEPGGRREVTYRVRSDLRGSYPLGPLQLRLSDPFGMCELTRSFDAHDMLTVVPRVEPLPPVRLTGAATGYGDGRQRSLALAGEDDVIPRGYRHGDDLRRVHWRSTARHGELMVRREEQQQKARCTVLLDTRRCAWSGSGPDAPFEWAVSGAASVCLHLLERGYAVRLLTDTGAVVPGPQGVGFAGDTSDTAGLLLDTLALVEHSAERGLAAAYDRLRGGAPGGAGGAGGDGLLIAFLGDLDGEEAATLARMRQRSDVAVAFVAARAGAGAGTAGAAVPAAVASPPGAPGGAGTGGEPAPGATGRTAAATGPEPAALRALREAGWTALPGGPGSALPRLWQEADNATLRGTGR